MSSLPTIELEPYQLERRNNDSKVIELFKSLFPDTPVPYEYIFDLVRFLEETKVNARVLPEVIRGVNNIIIGTGKGQVIVHVSKELMNVQIREQCEDMGTIGDAHNIEKH
jgi:hypothetical protein